MRILYTLIIGMIAISALAEDANIFVKYDKERVRKGSSLFSRQYKPTFLEVPNEFEDTHLTLRECYLEPREVYPDLKFKVKKEGLVYILIGSKKIDDFSAKGWVKVAEGYYGDPADTKKRAAYSILSKHHEIGEHSLPGLDSIGTRLVIK